MRRFCWWIFATTFEESLEDKVLLGSFLKESVGRQGIYKYSLCEAFPGSFLQGGVRRQALCKYIDFTKRSLGPLCLWSVLWVRHKNHSVY